MPPLIRRPPPAPAVDLPKQGPLSVFETIAAGLQGALGVNEPERGDFQDEAAFQTAAKPYAAGTLFSVLGPAVVASVVKAVKSGANAEEAVQAGIKAYHGSPHDFERFSTAKIGSGEGGQAYGHGLYFAEKEGTAREYQRNLSQPTVKVMGQDQPVPSWSPNLSPQPRVIRRLADQRALNPSASEDDVIWAVKHTLNKELSKASSDIERNHLQSQLDILGTMQERGLETKTGKMYEVNLHTSPDELLDWDKPLSQQPQKVQEALAKVGIAPDPNAFKWTAHQITEADVAAKTFGPSAHSGQWTSVLYDSGGRVVSHGGGLYGTQAGAAENAAARTAVNAPKGDTGEALYTNLVAKLGGRTGHTEGIASRKLREAGIQGIQYLDQGSRMNAGVQKLGNNWFFKGSSTPYPTEAAAQAALDASGQVSRNFVIFDDTIIEIAKKYGIPLAAAAEVYRRQQAQLQGEVVNK